MRKPASILLLAAIAMALVLLVGCDGEEADSGTPVAGTATSVAATPEAQASPGQPPPGSTTVQSAEEARRILESASVLIDDLGSGFAILNDEYADNAKASEAQPDPAAALTFLDGAGRLLGRTVAYIAEDTTGAAMTGQSVSFFSNVNVFQDATGATQYYALSAEMVGQGAGVGAQLGDLFVDPAAVQVAPVAFSDIGDESQAFTLTGETEAQGQLYPVTALMALIRRGPVTAFVGTVRVVVPPDVQEAEKLAQLLVDRIDQEL